MLTNISQCPYGDRGDSHTKRTGLLVGNFESSLGVARTFFVKHWTYGVASTRPCVHLGWLVITCAHFVRDQIFTQVKASFSPIGHPKQVNAGWVTSINPLLANEIEDSLPWFFGDLRVLARNLQIRLATQRKSLRRFNLRLLATPCKSVRPLLYS